MLFGPSLLPGEMFSERTRLDEGFLRNRLRSALAKLNSHLPAEAIEEAFRKVTMAGSPHLMVNNRAFHTMLVEGVDVEVMQDGQPDGGQSVLGRLREPGGE